MKRLILLLLLIVSPVVCAGVSTITVASDRDSVPVNAYLDVDAEYIAMSVILSSSADEPKRRTRLIQHLLSEIKAAAKKDGSIDLQMGSVSLSLNRDDSFSLSSSYGSSSQTDFYLLSPIAGKTDIYSSAQKLNRFVASIHKPDDTDIRTGTVSLAIKEPARFRQKLLEKIRNQITVTKESLGRGYKVSVSGLEAPVVVMQLNDRQVRLFIDYRLEFRE